MVNSFTLHPNALTTSLGVELDPCYESKSKLSESSISSTFKMYLEPKHPSPLGQVGAGLPTSEPASPRVLSQCRMTTIKMSVNLVVFYYIVSYLNPE